MKNLAIYCMVALLALGSCAKAPAEKKNQAEAYFEAWAKVNCPDAKKTEKGVYIIEDKEGSGAVIGDDGGYLRLHYTTYDLKGKINTTTSEVLAKQIGSYNETHFYGPRIFNRETSMLQVGMTEAVKDMKVGGKRKVAIPGWLFTTAKYDSIDDYIKNVSGTNAIYDIEAVEKISDIKKWEIDSIGSYLSRNTKLRAADSLKYGFYYIKDKAEKAKFEADTTFYINYIGRLLNGQVFDTNVRDTAIVYGLKKSEYTPVQINWKKEDYTEITMGSSKVVDGFAYGLHQMGADEKASFIFYSGLGYGNNANNNSIPEYSPLIFEVEIVNKGQ